LYEVLQVRSDTVAYFGSYHKLSDVVGELGSLGIDKRYLRSTSILSTNLGTIREALMELIQRRRMDGKKEEEAQMEECGG